MGKKTYDILNYDCKKAYEKVLDTTLYLEELDKALISFETQEKIAKDKDLENAFIIGFRGLQLLGNSVLLKKRNLKSKEKNCQFKCLYEENIVDEIFLDEISLLSIKRNNIYYHNLNIESEINLEEYIILNKIIEKHKAILLEILEK